jgi:vitamin B12 transporter
MNLEKETRKSAMPPTKKQIWRRKMKIKEKICDKLLWLILILMFSPGLSAFAQESGDEPLRKMEDMVVTAGRVKEMKKEITKNITVITEEEIRLSPARDLGELLAEENVGRIIKYPGALSGVGVQGARTDVHGIDLAGRVLLLVDGRRTGTGNTAKIMTENIERVEIIHGPASVQYGAAAMGGLINVITKRGKEKPSAFVEGKLGSFDYQESSIGFSGKTKGFDFSGSFSQSSVDDYDTGGGEKYENTGIDEQDKLSLNLGYEFLPDHRIGFIYQYYDASHIGDGGTLAPGYYKDPDDYMDKSLESYDFIYEGATRDKLFSWKARYFTSEDENTNYVVTTGTSALDYKSTTEPEGAQAQMTWSPKNYRLTAGVDWIHYDLSSTSTPKKGEYDNPSYFLLGKADYLDKRLILSAGLRYDDYEYEAKDQNIKSEDENTTPQIGIAYLPVENLKLRINYAEGFRMPAPGELAYDIFSYGVQYSGNPDLKPEQSQTYEAGLDFYYKYFDASLTYFHTEYKDKISGTFVSPTEYTYLNIGEATVSGFEGELSYDLAHLLNLSTWQIKPYASFVYLLDYTNEETGEDLEQISEYKGACGIRIHDLEGFSAAFNLTYTDHLTDYGGEKLPSYAVANLSVEKRLVNWGRYGDMSLRGEIKNLFDRDYAHKDGYPMPGRNFAIGLRYQF